MKRTLAILTAILLLAAFTACGAKPADTKTTAAPASASEAETENETEAAATADANDASAVYAAFLGQFEAVLPEMVGSLYVQDINRDGYAEVILRPAVVEDGEMFPGSAQYMATYTDKGGLCVISPDAHSSMGVDFRVSEDNCLYYTDDGHNVGTYSYHSGYIFSVDDTGFVLMGQVFGDEWPEDLDSSDLDLMNEMDDKYDKIFADKIRAVTGDKAFTDCNETESPADMDAYLNDALHIDVAAARQAYKDAQTRLQKAVADAAGKEPQSVFVSDYDRNGTYEAFAFVAEQELTEELSSGSAWFVNAQGEAKQIQTDVAALEQMGKLTCTYHDYFQAPLVGGSSAPTSVWEVRDDDCSAVGMFNIAEADLEIVTPANSEYLLPGTLISTRSAFDMSFTDEQVNEETGEPFGVGHTHKPYFFRDTPDGIKEYGGIEVSQSDVEKIDGGRELIALAQQDGKKIESIYYRENGVVSFSVSARSEGETNYFCFNAFLAENRLRLLNTDMLWTDASYGEYLTEGFYSAAASPDNATFPEKMPG